MSWGDHEGDEINKKFGITKRLEEESKDKAAKSKKKDYMPPDDGDICWSIGAETFTRKEVEHLLYTQRSMIGNDLKTNCGDQLTKDMFKVLDNARIPKF